MLEPFTIHTGIAAPILIDNIDTDQIIPSREMKTVSKTGLGAGLFAGQRYVTAGGRDPNPDFILNRPPFHQSSILLSGKNFGCGSSREHAVWALKDYGFRVVIAESFGEIFYNNCIRNGILPISLSKARITELAQTQEMTVDLQDCVIRQGNQVFNFKIPESERDLLLNGLDVIAQTLTHKSDIDAFSKGDIIKRPWVY